MDLDGWCLQGEWLAWAVRFRLGLDESRAGLDIGAPFLGVAGGVEALGVCGGREAGGFGVGGPGRGEGAEAGCVWGRLGAQLGEVQVGAGAVADVHGLAQLALGPVAVENDAIDHDGEEFDDDLYDSTYQRPVLGGLVCGQ